MFYPPSDSVLGDHRDDLSEQTDSRDSGNLRDLRDARDLCDARYVFGRRRSGDLCDTGAIGFGSGDAFRTNPGNAIFQSFR